MIAFGVITVWERLLPILPAAATHRGRKGSFWDLALELFFAIAAVSQGFWMRGTMRRVLDDSEDWLR